MMERENLLTNENLDRVHENLTALSKSILERGYLDQTFNLNGSGSILYCMMDHYTCYLGDGRGFYTWPVFMSIADKYNHALVFKVVKDENECFSVEHVRLKPEGRVKENFNLEYRISRSDAIPTPEKIEQDIEQKIKQQLWLTKKSGRKL